MASKDNVQWSLIRRCTHKIKTLLHTIHYYIMSRETRLKEDYKLKFHDETLIQLCIIVQKIHIILLHITMRKIKITFCCICLCLELLFYPCSKKGYLGIFKSYLCLIRSCSELKLNVVVIVLSSTMLMNIWCRINVQNNS